MSHSEGRGGDSGKGIDRRGNNRNRAARRRWLLSAASGFGGNGRSVPCAWCGKPVTAKTLEVDRSPIPGYLGGSYRRDGWTAGGGMSAPKFTHGPWSAMTDNAPDGCEVRAGFRGDGRPIVIAIVPPYRILVPDGPNARLLAASPDLYAALERLLAAPSVLSAATLKARAEAIAVLALARGEANCGHWAPLRASCPDCNRVAF